MRIVYHHVEIDFKNHSLMGADKNEMGKNMFVNLIQILQFYNNDKEKLEKLVEGKKTQIISSLEKLQKRLNIPKVISKYIANAVTILLARLFEVQIENVIIEFDRRDQNGSDLIDKEDHDLSPYNQYFEGRKRKVWMKFDFQNIHLVFDDSVVSPFSFRATSFAQSLPAPAVLSLTMTPDRGRELLLRGTSFRLTLGSL